MSETSIHPILGIVPARGGSKGLPKKNIRELAGLPLLIHSIRCAERCNRIARIIVSTDSDEIAQIAREHGGDVPFMRPPELASDTATLADVIRHALAAMEHAGQRYEAVLLLEPTCPCRLPSDIERAIDDLEASPEADGVVAVSIPNVNPFFVGVIEREGLIHPVFGREHSYKRRQDAPPFMRVNGMLYLWRRRWFERKDEHWLEAPHRPLLVDETRAIDIDDAHDLAVAQWTIETGAVQLPWLST